MKITAAQDVFFSSGAQAVFTNTILSVFKGQSNLIKNKI